MSEHRIFSMPFASVYTAYINKAERKSRTQQEVDRIICWLTGYSEPALQQQVAMKSTVRDFFAQGPRMNPLRTKVTGVVCGVRVEDVEDPLMQTIRQLDKLIDELAKGKTMEKILRE